MNGYRDEDEDSDDDCDADLGDDQDSDDEPTVACPYCRREILDDTPRCPYCNRSISAEYQAGPREPLCIIATALVCLGIALWWVFQAF